MIEIESPVESREVVRQRRNELRQAIYARDSHRCALCGCSDALTVHHIRPRSVGGSNARWNLITLCEPCHLQLNQGAAKLGNWFSSTMLWFWGLVMLRRRR